MGDRAASMPRIGGYHSAEMKLETTKPVRGRPDCIPLGNGYWRRFNHMNIRRYGSHAIACRLYSTDCVTFYDDGEIGIQPWSSKTTNDFVNAILRDHNVQADFDKSKHSLFWMRCWNGEDSEWRAYSIGRDFRFRHDPKHPGCYTAVSGWVHNAFEFTRVNRKEARKALAETRYSEFRIWSDAVRAMAGTFIEAPKIKRYGFGFKTDERKPMENGRILRCLAEGVEGWLEIIKHRGIRCQNDVRNAIYSTSKYNCFYTESLDYLSGPVNQYVHRIWMSYASRLD